MSTQSQSVNKANTSLSLLTWVVLLSLALTAGLSNALAALNMQTFHQNAQANTIAICTGSGMAYIDETKYLLTGEIEYLEQTDTVSIQSSDNHIQYDCYFSLMADKPVSALHELTLSLGLIAAAATQALRESRAVQTHAYLASQSRAPPTAY